MELGIGIMGAVGYLGCVGVTVLVGFTLGAGLDRLRGKLATRRR